jgi:hypothetical protein
MFNLKSLNMGMDRRIAKDKIIGFALSLGKHTRIFKAGGFKGKCVATKAEFSLISATSNRKIYTPLAGSKCNYFGYKPCTKCQRAK